MKKRFYKKSIFVSIAEQGRNIPLIVALLIVGFGVLYLSQVNSLATKGYEINSLEQKAQVLRDENKKLEILLTDLRALPNIEQRLADAQMVPVTHVDYISSSVASVAIAR